MRLPRYLLPSLILAVFLAVPAAAGAVIVPQRGMLGVNIGQTTAQARAILGPPDAVSHPTNEIFGRYTRYRYGEVRVSFFSSNGEAFQFDTTGKSARTTRGVGVGSTEAFVKANLRGEACSTVSGFRHCALGPNPASAGSIVTDFAISRRTARVTRVTIGRVID